MFKVLLHIWQFPQSLLAFIMLKILRKRVFSVEHYKHTNIYRVENFGRMGISLGMVILLDCRVESPNYIPHEYGHSIQSLILGPLYLFIVGAPSMTMNVLSRHNIIDSSRYYQRWPETWADRLGGVKR